jgi:hypothetical protein
VLRTVGVDAVVGGAIFEFWQRHGVVSSEAAPSRLPLVRCVLLDGDDVVGTCSTTEVVDERFDSRRFFLYQRFIAPAHRSAAEQPLVLAAYEHHDAAFVTTKQGPIGLLWRVDDADVVRAHSETIWPVSGMTYVGYDDDGRQLRVRYFTDARIN